MSDASALPDEPLTVDQARERALDIVRAGLNLIPAGSRAPDDRQPPAIGAVPRTLHPGQLPGTFRYPGTAAVRVRSGAMADEFAARIVDLYSSQPGWARADRLLDEQHSRVFSPDGYEASVSSLRPDGNLPLVSITVMSPDFLPPEGHAQVRDRY